MEAVEDREIQDIHALVMSFPYSNADPTTNDLKSVCHREKRRYIPLPKNTSFNDTYGIQAISYELMCIRKALTIKI